MQIRPFKLERFFSEHEFRVRHNISASDCEPLTQAEVLEMADDDARERWDELRLGYTETPGALFLREEIAKLYLKIDPDDVLVLTPIEGIFVVMNTILERGDHVICTFPEYQALYEVAQHLECEVDMWPADERQGWRFDPLWLEKHIRPNTKLVVVNFPHNPTGWMPDAADFKRIVDLARASGAYLFSDEMYHYLEHDPVTRLPAACDTYERAVCLNGMSKSFALAGIRIGWLATQDAELMQRLATFKDYTTICSSAPSEVLATIGLQSMDRIIERNLSLINQNLDLLDDFFEKHPFAYWNKPIAGTVAFPRLLIDRDAREFCEDLIAKSSVMMLPGEVFEYGSDHVRIGFARRHMDSALEALGKYLVTAGL